MQIISDSLSLSDSFLYYIWLCIRYGSRSDSLSLPIPCLYKHVTPEENNLLSNTMASCLPSVHVCREMNPVKDQALEEKRVKTKQLLTWSFFSFYNWLNHFLTRSQIIIFIAHPFSLFFKFLNSKWKPFILIYYSFLFFVLGLLHRKWRVNCVAIPIPQNMGFTLLPSHKSHPTDTSLLRTLVPDNIYSLK